MGWIDILTSVHLGVDAAALSRPKSVDLLRRVSPAAIFLRVVPSAVTWSFFFLLSHASTSAPLPEP